MRFTAADVGLQEAFRRFDQIVQRPFCVGVALQKPPGQEARSGAQQVDALVPLANMFGYATDLRSSTQGRGQYSMEPHSYVEIPKSITDKIVEKRNSAD